MSNLRQKFDLPHPADAYAGKILRAARVQQKMNQDKLAALLGITYQQVQKYEKAEDRMSVSRLADICNAMELKPEYFFEVQH